MIEVDPAVFAWNGVGTNEFIAVRTDDADDQVVGGALMAGAERFSCVDGDGAERVPDAAGEIEDFVIHYVSDPRRTVAGIELEVDFGGSEIGPGMRSTLVAILVDELRRAGVKDASISDATPPQPPDTPLSPEERAHLREGIEAFRRALDERRRTDE